MLLLIPSEVISESEKIETPRLEINTVNIYRYLLINMLLIYFSSYACFRIVRKS